MQTEKPDLKKKYEIAQNLSWNPSGDEFLISDCKNSENLDE